MTTIEHRHDFKPASVSLPNGSVAGGRCDCGMEVIGTTGPFRMDANFLRVAQHFNAAVERGMRDVAEAFRRAR